MLVYGALIHTECKVKRKTSSSWRAEVFVCVGAYFRLITVPVCMHCEIEILSNFLEGHDHKGNITFPLAHIFYKYQWIIYLYYHFSRLHLISFCHMPVKTMTCILWLNKNKRTMYNLPSSIFAENLIHWHTVSFSPFSTSVCIFSTLNNTLNRNCHLKPITWTQLNVSFKTIVDSFFFSFSFL